MLSSDPLSDLVNGLLESDEASASPSWFLGELVLYKHHAYKGVVTSVIIISVFITSLPRLLGAVSRACRLSV